MDVFEPATMLITASSTWEFQLAHQTWNTKPTTVWNLVFSCYHLYCCWNVLVFFKSYFTWPVANKSWFSVLQQLVTADWECRKAEMNCPGLSVAHQRDVGIEMPVFWRGDDQCEFEACLCHTPCDKIFLTSALRKILILPELVRVCLARSTFWYIISWNFHWFHRRIAVFLKQTQPRLIISQQGQENRNCSSRLTLKESNWKVPNLPHSKDKGY